MRRRLVAFPGLALAGLLATGCTSRVALRHPETSARIQLAPEEIRLTRIAEGRSCVTGVLGVELEPPSYLEAQTQALKAAGAEHLLGEIAYDGVENAFAIPAVLPTLFGPQPYLFLFYGQHCHYVEGHGANRRAPPAP